MSTKKLTKLLALYLPYILLGLVATNFGEAWRLAESKELGERIMSMIGTIPSAFANPLPSLHPLDLLIGRIVAKQKCEEIPARHGVRLCPVGQHQGHRAISGPEIRGQYHPDKNGTADDEQPTARPEKCPEQKCADRRRFWLR